MVTSLYNISCNCSQTLITGEFTAVHRLGLILIPSDLRILTKPIPGFSNVLTVAKNGMMFGKNEKVNYTSNPVPTPTNNIDESHDITPAPTVDDFKPPRTKAGV